MKHPEIKAFVRKYNNEISIKGYSKMRKAELAAAVNSALTHSRKELKQEWRQLNGHSAPAKPKTKPKEEKKTKKTTATERKDDEWHRKNKDTSGQAQSNRLNQSISTVERRAAIQRDKVRVRRIRGNR
jgi:hypothetical protein